MKVPVVLKNISSLPHIQRYNDISCFMVQIYFMNVFSPDMMGTFLKESVKS